MSTHVEDPAEVAFEHALSDVARANRQLETALDRIEKLWLEQRQDKRMLTIAVEALGVIASDDELPVHVAKDALGQIRAICGEHFDG